MKMRSPLNIHFCIELSDLPKHWINRELEGKKTFEVEKKTNLFQIKPKVCLQMLSLWMIGTTCSIEENPTSAAIACCHGIKGSWKKKLMNVCRNIVHFFRVYEIVAESICNQPSIQCFLASSCLKSHTGKLWGPWVSKFHWGIKSTWVLSEKRTGCVL